MEPRKPYKRTRHLARITTAGSLYMIFLACVSSPVTTDLFRSLGTTEFQFGLLGGLPLAMLSMQFLGAYWTNRMRSRRLWFMVLVLGGRLMYIPIALLPLLSGMPPALTVSVMIGLIAISSAVTNLTIPMWFSWMGDLIPRRILNRYWGGRQRYLTLTLTLSALAITVFTFYGEAIPVRALYLALAIVGCTAGTIDILLFRRVREPPNVTTDAHPLHVLAEPLRHRDYRSVVLFQCVFAGVTMMAAAFMLVYVLNELRVPLWQTSLVWCAPGLGMAVVAPLWGQIADRFGHRPVLKVCVALKPAIALVFLLVTRRWVVPVLCVALFFDSMLNAGQQLAVNGYMLKMAPRQNRSMFIAALTALTGMAAGLGAILGGAFLRHTGEFAVTVAGRDWNHYHLLFFSNFLLRIPCFWLAARIREPESSRSRVVVAYLMGTWPFRMLSFPVGLYRRFRFPDER